MIPPRDEPELRARLSRLAGQPLGAIAAPQLGEGPCSKGSSLCIEIDSQMEFEFPALLWPADEVELVERFRGRTRVAAELERRGVRSRTGRGFAPVQVK
jgi:hypothetical protein